ncbi:MAG: response regulator, partial [Acidimicrobiia bacterium]
HSPDAMTLSEAVRREDGRALDMRLLYMNRKAREGQPNPDEAIGRLCSELWPDMVSNGSFQACMRVLDSGDGEQGEFFWTDDATYRPAGYEWRAVRVGSEVLLWVLRDVSDRLRREQAVAEVYERVVQSLTAATMARELGDEDVMATELAAALAAAKVLATRELPAVPAPKTAASPPPPARVQADGPVRTLICDDDPVVRRVLRLALDGAYGFTVVAEAADGREAVAQAELLQPDLVLIDLTMPVMSGDEAIPLVRQAAPDTTVVVISGLLENAVAPQVEALGAAAYVEKGTPVRVILERLRDVLGVAPGPSPDPLK